MMRDSKNCTKVRQELLFKQKKTRRINEESGFAFIRHHSWMMLDEAFFLWPQCITQEFGAPFQLNEVDAVLTVFSTQSDR